MKNSKYSSTRCLPFDNFMVISCQKYHCRYFALYGQLPFTRHVTTNKHTCYTVNLSEVP